MPLGFSDDKSNHHQNKSIRDPLSKKERTSLEGMANPLDRLERWSWHQSHDQATVLVLVPADTEEVDVSAIPAFSAFLGILTLPFGIGVVADIPR